MLSLLYLPFCQRLLSKSLLSLLLQDPATPSLHFLCEYITKENRKCILAFRTPFSCQNVPFNNIHLGFKCIMTWEEIWTITIYHKLGFGCVLKLELDAVKYGARVGLCFSLSIWKQYWKWKRIIRIKEGPRFLFKAILSCLDRKEKFKKSSLQHMYVYSNADRMGISLYTSKGETCFWSLNLHFIG